MIIIIYNIIVQLVVESYAVFEKAYYYSVNVRNFLNKWKVTTRYIMWKILSLWQQQQQAIIIWFIASSYWHTMVQLRSKIWYENILKNNLDNDWANFLVGLHLKVSGSWFNRDDHHNKRQTFVPPHLSSYSHKKGIWSIILDTKTVPYSI